MKTNHAGGNLDNVVFENRNKNYGAYALRRDHDKRVILAFFIASGVLFLSFYTPIFMKRFSNEIILLPEDTTQVWDTVYVDLTPDAPPKPPKPVTPPPAPTHPTQALGTTVVDSLEQTDTTRRVATQDDPSFNTNVLNGAGNPDPGPGNTGGQTAGTGTETDSITPNPDIMPEFPGGERGRANFFVNNTRFSSTMRETPGTHTVYLNFIIDKDGSVSEIKILKKAGWGYDEEAARVAGNMPKWKPGILRGKPARVIMSMPVRYVVK